MTITPLKNWMLGLISSILESIHPTLSPLLQAEKEFQPSQQVPRKLSSSTSMSNSPSKRLGFRSQFIEQLSKWHDLLEKGGINEQQYEDLKQTILGDISNSWLQTLSRRNWLPTYYWLYLLSLTWDGNPVEIQYYNHFITMMMMKGHALYKICTMSLISWVNDPAIAVIFCNTFKSTFNYISLVANYLKHVIMLPQIGLDITEGLLNWV